MNKPLKYSILLILLCILSTSRLNAQHERFTIEIPHTGAPTLFSFDDAGFIWFGKNAGEDYSRYHGHGTIDLNTTELFDMESTRPIIENPLFIADKLVLRTNTELSLLDLTDRSIEIIWPIPIRHSIEYFTLDDNKNLIVFTKNKDKGSRPVYRRNKDGKWEMVYDIAKYIGNERTAWWSAISMSGDETYIHRRRKGLTILDYQGNQKELDLKDRSKFDEEYDCSLFRMDNKNNLWKIHKETLSVYDPILRKFVKHPVSGKIAIQTECTDMSKYNYELNVVLIDKKNRIWFAGGQSNIKMYDPQTDKVTSFSKRITDLIGGNGGDIHDLQEDKHGNIFGTKRGGMFKISETEQLFETYAVNTNSEEHSIYDYTGDPMFEQVVNYLKPSNIVRTDVGSVVEHNGDIYFIDYRFVYKVDQKTKQAKVMPFYHPVTKTGLYTHNDRLIASSWGEIFNLDDNFQHQKHDFTPSRLEGIFQQSSGDTWIYGYWAQNAKTSESTTLFAKVDRETLAFSGNYKDPQGLVDFDNIRVFDMGEDDSGNLWLATKRGIYEIDKSDGVPRKREIDFSGRKKNFTFLGENFNYISIKEKSLLCISSKKEIAVLNIEDFHMREYVSVDELGITNIDGAVFTSKNEVWFGSNSGLGYYNFQTQKHINFSYQAGLDKVLWTTTMDELEDGRVALATANGLFIYDPKTLLDSYARKERIQKDLPLSLVTYSYIDGNDGKTSNSPLSLSDDHSITLDYNDRMLKLELGLMHYSHPDQHQYSHWLKGYDTDWSIPNNENHIEYSSLPPGRYTLKVKAHTGNGIWSDDIKSIPIVVKAVWYKRWYSIILFLFLAAALASALFKHYLFLAKEKINKTVKQKEAIRLKELDVAKNIFFANISHEFRTPLTVIMGINENIEDHQEEKLLIRRNSNHLLKLVNQLLDLSKLESNKMSLNLSQGDIIAYLRYLTASFFSMAGDKKINLDFVTDLDSLVMNYDEIRIQQICYNLLSNAIKFTEMNGSVSLSVKEIEYQGKPFVSIAVKDTGHGIKEEDLPKVFDHFYQVNNSMAKSGEGSGIGLALVKELLTLMKGKIEVKSILDVGTEFKILLPINAEITNHLVESIFEENNTNLNRFRADNELGKLATLPSHAVPEDQDDSLPVLLLIEDNLDVITYIVSILKMQYQIIICENGALGIEKAIEVVPDIIISDVMMPVKDGYEVLKELKNHATTDHIPIILLTAKSAISDKIEGLKYGADAYLHKPFNKEELHVRLEQLLLNRKKIQERFAQTLILPVSDEQSQEDVFYNKLKDAVFSHLSDNLFGVPELAQAMLMSQTQLFRKTKAILDKTPALFIRSIRLEKAKVMLSNSDSSIADIARQTGFRDPSYFSRAFLKEFGTSPSDFRK